MDHMHNVLKDEWDIDYYNINSDGSVDVMQNIDIYRDNELTELPFKFNIIHGSFCFTDSKLTTLNNMPSVVLGDFNISNNNMTSLMGCPHTIKGNFNCSHNMLQSTYVGDYDVIIGGDIECHANDFDLTFQDAIADYENFDAEDDDMGDLVYFGDLIKLVFKYQRPFEIWVGQGLSINDKNFQEFLDEVKDGLE